MKVGDLVKIAWFEGQVCCQLGIIVADGSFSWQKGKHLWVVQWANGKRGTSHEHQLEALCK